MENIQPAERNVGHAADIVPAVIPGLIMSDQRAADGLGEIAHDIRITAAPAHPGCDPVSVHIVDQVASVLRGEDGLAHRIAAVMERLRSSAARLDASWQLYQATDQNAADAFKRILDERQP